MEKKAKVPGLMKSLPGEEFRPFQRDEPFRDDKGPLGRVRGTPESIQNFGQSVPRMGDRKPPAPARAKPKSR